MITKEKLKELKDKLDAAHNDAVKCAAEITDYSIAAENAAGLAADLAAAESRAVHTAAHAYTEAANAAYDYYVAKKDLENEI